MEKLALLKNVFGYDSFRPGQEEIIDQLVAGGDVLAVMPTGAGKSLCYQVPALLREGIAIVISPLISLMNDQVQALCQAGVRAAYLNSSLSEAQCRRALANAAAGVYKIIYVAPERLMTPSFLTFALSAPLSLICVDEAHCVSQWGQDFRPSYTRIAEFVSLLPQRPPLGAFTATATARVRDDIRGLLQLRQPLELTTGFDRPNLYFEVQRIAVKEKPAALRHYLDTHADAFGIVYCSTRKSVDEVYASLCAQGFAAARYHAGLSGEERSRSQEDFLYDRVHVMVATNAFGMGIDKSNVNFVIHYNMPLDIESYYQEAGRAGRDGQPADCILLYAPGDVRLGEFLLTHGEGAADETQLALQRDRLRQMTFYCHSKYCLRGELLRYFGEHPPRECGNCSICQPGLQKAGVAAVLAKAARRRAAADEAELDHVLLDKLKALRLELAKRAGVPAFVVFSDATLRDMCVKDPQDEQAFLTVSGVGQVKFERYGAEFLKLLRSEHDKEA